jgi:hypothetical protein
MPLRIARARPVGRPGYRGRDHRHHPARVGGRGLRRVLDRVHAPEEVEVELVDALEHVLLHLDGVEEARVSPVGIADARRDLVEALSRGLDVVDRVEGAHPAGRDRGAIERLLARLESQREKLALDTVGVPAQFLLAIAREPRDRVHELLEGVLAGARLVQDVVHDFFLHGVSLRLPTRGGRVKASPRRRPLRPPSSVTARPSVPYGTPGQATLLARGSNPARCS